MKTKQQIDDALQVLRKRLQTPGLNDVQKALVGGMLNALVWAADGPNSSTIDRMLSGEPLAAGKDPKPALERMEDMVTFESRYECPNCGGPISRSRLRGLFCPTCA